MKSADSRHFRAELLLQRFFDGTLDDQGGRELLTLWKESPRLHEHARMAGEIDLYLNFLGCLERERDFQKTVQFPDLDELVRLAASSPTLACPGESPENNPVKKSFPPIPKNRSNSVDVSGKPLYRNILLIVLLLLILLPAAVYYEFTPSAATQPLFEPIALIDEAVDLRFSDETRILKRGQGLRSSRIRFDSGIMALKLRNGVSVVMEGPADFDLSTEMKTFCNRGRFSVTVPPEAKGFEIITPSLSVVDLGTRFVVDIDDRDRVAVHTISGLVQVDRLPGEVVRLPEGDALGLSGDRKIVRGPADQSIFLSDDRLQNLVAEWDEKTYAIFQRQVAQRDDDPGLLVDFDFVPQNGHMPNRARRSGETGNGTILGGQPQPGRWPRTSAYAFSRPTHGVDIDLSQTLRSMTLSVSLRIDQLDKFNQVLLASREDKAGGVLWQIRRDGTVHFGVQPNRNQSFVNYTAAKVFPPETWGAWFQLTVVMDAENKRIAFYLDGHRVAEHVIDQSIPVRAGRATLGNSFGKDVKTTERFFNGAFERFLLFDRALSEQEVRMLFSTF